MRTHLWRIFKIRWSVHSLSTAQFLLDLGFPCLRLETVRSEKIFQDHLHPSLFISPLTTMTCPRKVTTEWFSEAGLNPKLLCVILSLGFFLPSVALLLCFAQPPPSHGNIIILYFGLINPPLPPCAKSHVGSHTYGHLYSHQRFFKGKHCGSADFLLCIKGRSS